MSEENVEIVRRMYHAYHRGDSNTALAHFAPEVVTDFSRRLGGRITRGRDELVAMLSEWRGTFEDYREEINEILEVGHRVCAVATQHGRGKGSGVDVETTYAVLYEIQDGQITALTAYPTRAEALEAAGLSE